MLRSFGGTSFISSPSINSSPSVMSSRPATIRRVVDLPHPDGPTNTTNSWSSTVMLALSTARTFPSYTLPMPLSSTLAI